MKVKEFHDVLDESGADILHGKLVFDQKNKLVKFSLNYATIKKDNSEEKKVEVVRFDCSHGQLHMHKFYRIPPATEEIHLPISMDSVKELVVKIRENWSEWKKMKVKT